MAGSIAAAVGRIKRDPSDVLDRARVHRVCEELGHAWRERELDPATTFLPGDELAMFCIAYNLVRVVMLRAAARQEVPVSRVSFADALKWMRHARPGGAMPDLVVNPRRPGRAEPRCKKRRAKQSDLMNKPRDVLRQALKKQRQNA